MEELSLDNILTDEELSLFDEENHEETDSPASENKEEDNTAEIDVDSLFQSESVGSEENKETIEEKEDTVTDKGNTSPNFYSSIANALVEDGIFQNLDNEELSKVNTAEDFAELVSKQVQSQLDERQRRIDEALNVGIEPTEIQKYERSLHILSGISDEKLSEESTEAENIRKNLIFQDYINRGFSKERAMKELDKSFKNGTDIEDAREALKSAKDFYQTEYDNLIQEAKEEEEAARKESEKEVEKLRKSILEESNVFGDIEVDKVTRQKVFDSIMKPTYTDPETGARLTALQKYQMENRSDFLKNLGLVFVLTDGFKNLDGMVKGKVKKEMKKGIKELENVINNTSRTNSGNLNFASGVSDSNSKHTIYDLDI